MLSEIGSSIHSEDQAAWLRSALAHIRRTPSVKAVVWFDADTPDADFRLSRDTLRTLSHDGRRQRLRVSLRTQPAPD